MGSNRLPKRDRFAEKVIERYCRITKGNRTPEQRRFAIERYLHRRKGKEGTLTIEEWNEICERYNYRCHWCGEEITEMTKEHLIPKSMGGGFTKENIAPACGICNNNRSHIWQIFENKTVRKEVHMSDLVQCRHCFGTVAKSARTCPHCGGKDPTKKGQVVSLLAGLAMTVLCVVIMFILI